MTAKKTISEEARIMAASKKLLATHGASKAKARAFLVKLGTHTKTGRLSKNYGG